MDAQPELALLARAINECGLEAILIGNMAAALHGAPVSTIDIDLFFRKTPRNMQKLKRVAGALGAVILRPYYPVSALFRLQRERWAADRFHGTHRWGEVLRGCSRKGNIV